MRLRTLSPSSLPSAVSSLPSAATTGRSGFSRALAATALVAGVAVGGVATAAPVDASESMSTKLHKLRSCESANHYGENTGNGYFGAYQFARSTWHALGYRGRPDHARATTQDSAATELHSRQGWRPWPSCARREHL